MRYAPRTRAALVKREDQKLRTQTLLDEAFPAGAVAGNVFHQEETFCASHSISYTVVIMQNTTSQHVNLLLLLVLRRIQFAVNAICMVAGLNKHLF